MYDPVLSHEIHGFAAKLDLERARLIATTNSPAHDYDLVLDIIKTDDETIWAYYYVDHKTRTLFWLHDYECGDTLLGEVDGARAPSHVSAYFVIHQLIPFG